MLPLHGYMPKAFGELPVSTASGIFATFAHIRTT